MANCKTCGEEMSFGNAGCDHLYFTSSNRKKGVKIRIVHSVNAKTNCSSCGVRPGGLHHTGCRKEKCPWCKKRFNVNCTCE